MTRAKDRAARAPEHFVTTLRRHAAEMDAMLNGGGVVEIAYRYGCMER